MVIIDWQAPQTPPHPAQVWPSQVLQVGYYAERVLVLIPLRHFAARKRPYRFLSQGEPFVQTFAKEPTESYHLAIDFGGKLPMGAALVSGGLVATDEATGVDVTATVLASALATIQGTDAVLTPQSGTHGHDYLLTLTAVLSTGLPLVENLRMQVRSRL